MAHIFALSLSIYGLNVLNLPSQSTQFPALGCGPPVKSRDHPFLCDICNTIQQYPRGVGGGAFPPAANLCPPGTSCERASRAQLFAMVSWMGCKVIRCAKITRRDVLPEFPIHRRFGREWMSRYLLISGCGHFFPFSVWMGRLTICTASPTRDAKKKNFFENARCHFNVRGLRLIVSLQ